VEESREVNGNNDVNDKLQYNSVISVFPEFLEISGNIMQTHGI
jgi:hypothetical protein